MTSDIEFGCADVLQPVSPAKWPLLQEFLKIGWPKYSHYYYWIQNSIKWKNQDPQLAIQIYSPRGDHEDDVTFVGISSFSTYDVVIFTKETSGERLYKALTKTNRLDWSREIVFCGIDEYLQSTLMSALAELRTDLGIETKEAIPSNFYIKSAEDCGDMEIKVPEECYLGNLNSSHIFTIHSLWPYADKEEPQNSIKLIRAMITRNESVGLFLREGDTLVSWALHNEWHGIGVVQTLESYKRKGYATIVVNALAKSLGEKGISPIITVTSGNIASENLFMSLNWKRTSSSLWLIMKKKSSSLR